MANEKKSGSSPAGIGCGVLLLALGIVTAVVNNFDTGGTSYLVGFGLVGLIIISLNTNRNSASGSQITDEMQSSSEESKIDLDSMTDAEKEEFERKQEQEKKYFSGKYVSGHPEIVSPIAITSAEVNDSEVVIYPITQPSKLGPAAGRIPIAAISNVVVEDRTTVEKRITATRLLAVGVFALAAKKTEVHPEFYVTVTWGGGKIANETIFEFEGQNAQTSANYLRNIIAKRVNASGAV
jgi:hypothetical protein